MSINEYKWNFPIKNECRENVSTIAVLRLLGFTRFSTFNQDEISALPPENWVKVRDGYSTNIYDEKGVKRIYVFRKSAFYDLRKETHFLFPVRIKKRSFFKKIINRKG